MPPRSDPRPLSTSAHAVLCLLGLRSWTGYELTQQAKRSLRFAWPKAESLLYALPPRLVGAGAARVERERAGGRQRNRYTITRSGRAALRRWLATEPAAPQFDAEAVLRIMFADLGTIDDARRAVASLRAWAMSETAAGVQVLETHERGDAPFPEREHVNVLAAHCVGRVWEAVLEWAELADAELDRWVSTKDPGEAARTHELLADALRRGRATLARHGDVARPSRGRVGEGEAAR
jgi:DNA-binding PadR family transcriptional regulator